jgi:hypothetical protein
MFYREYKDETGFWHGVYLIHPDDPLETGLRVTLNFEPIAEHFGLNAGVHENLWQSNVKNGQDYFVAGIYERVVFALQQSMERKPAKILAHQLISHVRSINGNQF